MPTKILQSLKIQDLAFYTKNEATAVKIFDLLLEPQKSLLRWIIDLMVETVKYAEHNQVSPRDIGNTYFYNIIENQFRNVNCAYIAPDLYHER